MDEIETLTSFYDFKKEEIKYTKCIEEFEGANPFMKNVERRNQLAVAYNNRGQAKYKQVKFDDAVEDYSKAIYYDPTLPVAFYNRGTIYYRMGDFQKAADDFQKSIQLFPTFEEASIALRKTNYQLSFAQGQS